MRRSNQPPAAPGTAVPRAPASSPLAPRSPVRARKAQAPAPESRATVLGGQHIPYVLKVSARARRVRLVVRPESGLEVVVPQGTPASIYETLLHDKAHWVVTTLQRMARESAAVAPPPLVEGQRLPFAGRELLLALRTGAPEGRFRATLSANTLTLTVASLRPEVVRIALETWYRRQAAAVFAERLTLCNHPYGYRYGRVSIKSQKSRWGSCSKLGNLNFNWRLLLAPLAVLDYVVVHELCHLKELNHSPRFWKLVAVGCPEHALQRRWLRQHGRELTF